LGSPGLDGKTGYKKQQPAHSNDKTAGDKHLGAKIRKGKNTTQPAVLSDERFQVYKWEIKMHEEPLISAKVRNVCSISSINLHTIMTLYLSTGSTN
jgi:hypothetical protein